MNPTAGLEGTSVLLGTAYTLRFLLELALFTGIAYLAWHLGHGWWRWPLVLLALSFAVVVWGTFLSPKAAVPLTWPAALGLESVLFLGTGAGLALLGHLTPAVIGVSLWAVDKIVLTILGGGQS